MADVAAEPVTWTGRPRGGLRFQRGDWFLIPFSVVWCSFAVVTFFFASTTPTKGRPDVLWPLIPFVVFGLYFVVGRFLVDMYLRSQTNYELRGASALIRRGGPFGNTTEVYLPSVSALNLDLRRDGSGTIYFGPRPSFWNGAGWGGYSPNSPAFVMIDHVQDVFDRCKALQRR